MRPEIRRTTLEKTFVEQGTLNRHRMSVVRVLGKMTRLDQEGNGDAGGSRERRKHDEILQSEVDQQSEINLARGEATRLRQC